MHCQDRRCLRRSVSTTRQSDSEGNRNRTMCTPWKDDEDAILKQLIQGKGAYAGAKINNSDAFSPAHCIVLTRFVLIQSTTLPFIFSLHIALSLVRPLSIIMPFVLDSLCYLHRSRFMWSNLYINEVRYVLFFSTRANQSKPFYSAGNL